VARLKIKNKTKHKHIHIYAYIVTILHSKLCLSCFPCTAVPDMMSFQAVVFPGGVCKMFNHFSFTFSNKFLLAPAAFSAYQISDGDYSNYDGFVH